LSAFRSSLFQLEILSPTAQAIYYTVPQYDYDEIHKAWEYFRTQLPKDEIRAALWNVTEAVRQPFLDMKREDI